MDKQIDLEQIALRLVQQLEGSSMRAQAQAEGVRMLYAEVKKVAEAAQKEAVSGQESDKPAGAKKSASKKKP